jgi:hypothetical protein
MDRIWQTFLVYARAKGIEHRNASRGRTARYAKPRSAPSVAELTAPMRIKHPEDRKQSREMNLQRLRLEETRRIQAMIGKRKGAKAD